MLWLASGLARRGHRSLVAARPGEPLAERARDAGLPIVACTPHLELDPIAAFALRRVIQRERVHVVHAHTAHALAIGALATAGTDAALVVSRRVDFPLRRNPGTRWKYSRAAVTVAISEAVAAVLQRSGIPRARIRVVPDGVDLSRVVALADHATLSALGIPAGAPLVVQVAALVPHKDPLTFVRACATVRAQVPTAYALMVGDGPLRHAIETEARYLGLDGVVRLAGYRADADSLLAAADVATLSSREEGMGSVILDAMALGRPVAATAAGGIPEVIQHDVNGLLAPPGDAATLGRNIAALLTDSNLSRRIVEAAFRRVEDFSVDRMVERTELVYADVVGARLPA